MKKSIVTVPLAICLSIGILSASAAAITYEVIPPAGKDQADPVTGLIPIIQGVDLEMGPAPQSPQGSPRPSASASSSNSGKSASSGTNTGRKQKTQQQRDSNGYRTGNYEVVRPRAVGQMDPATKLIPITQSADMGPSLAS